MSNLVYLSPNTEEPFTTSEVIAECAGVKRDTVQKLVQRHEKDLHEFGKVGFEIRPLSGSKTGQTVKVYHLNEQQATLLLTFLRNTPVVIEFKKELVRQFFAMRKELMNIKAIKAERKPLRTSMTDAIKALPDSPHNQFKYSQYTDLAYMAALGKTARQLRKERGAEKSATASDYMSSDELAAVSKMENRISVLLEVGMDYQKVKNCLMQTKAIGA
jgi:phage regulator Rha-like protein|nr:MAG TPA: hypothetical protein [Siphoviridae sp. ctoof1]